MNRLDDIDNDQPEAPEEIVLRFFSRCHNFPKDRLGVIGLAQCLARAAQETGYSALLIAQRLADDSPYCPTDFDILNAAYAMKKRAADQEQARQSDYREMVNQYGPPQPFETRVDPVVYESEVARQTEMWARIRKHLKLTDINWPGWKQCASAARELGYPDYADAWEHSFVR